MVVGEDKQHFQYENINHSKINYSENEEKRQKDFNLARSSEGFGIFCIILWKWRGSVYKLLYRDVAIYLTLYYSIRLLYIYGLNDTDRIYFEEIVKFCRKYTDQFPLSFVLGFFVTTVMSRWWTQYIAIPRPHGIGVLVSSLIHGNDKIGKKLRRTILRYVCLSITMVLRKLSPRAHRKFPTKADLMFAGLLKEDELAIFMELKDYFPGNSMHILPIDWAMSIVEKARNYGRIKYDLSFKTLVDELKQIQKDLELLVKYNLMNISMVYCQVVIIACYSYFLAELFGSQIVKLGEDKEPLINFANYPVFLVLLFIFYMGWLKVGEALMDPFGDDDDDIDVCALIEKYLEISYLIVDKFHEVHPITLCDEYWSEKHALSEDIDNNNSNNNLTTSMNPDEVDTGS